MILNSEQAAYLTLLRAKSLISDQIAFISREAKHQKSGDSQSLAQEAGCTRAQKTIGIITCWLGRAG